MNPYLYILVLTGDGEAAQRIAAQRYPGLKAISLSKRELREGGWRRQVQALRKLQGEVFLVFVDDRKDVQEPLLLKLTILWHRCRETVIADSQGETEVLRRSDIWKLLPETAVSVVADACVFLAGWIGLHLLRLLVRKTSRYSHEDCALDVAFLYPFPMDRSPSGGAMSHVRGFLSGLRRRSTRCEIFSGRALPLACFPVHEIADQRRFYVLRESPALTYNLEFAREAERKLTQQRPSFIYQRHGRYVVAGALLARRLRRPLVLEYNGSEVWIAKHWDPPRFLPWLKLCEDISLAAATLIVVVSEPLKTELMERGIPEEKVLVNPNAVDPERFHPDCGGQAVRRKLGFQDREVVVGFIGTFSYWHGVAILQTAIQALLQEQESDRSLPELRFLLVGDGPFGPEMREALEPYRQRGWVVFTGQVAHDLAPSYLDSADILVSPHVPMPDGKPFFGSPTKLFEYMAMGKAIVASNLDQLARVLSHQQTAWLVQPGNANELVHAIRLLAGKPEMRNSLGKNARESALSRYTWEQNASRVLAAFADSKPSTEKVLSEPVRRDSE